MSGLSRKQTGFIYGLVSSGSYGLIPLFTLPLFAAGISAETALAWRFTVAAIAMGIILIIRKERFAIGWPAFIKLSGLSLLYMGECLLFFHAFRYLPSGIVATINFQYPVMVILIMVFFFHERFRWQTVSAVLLAVAGVALLSLGPMGEPADAAVATGSNRILTGILLTLMAALANAIYYVGIQVAKLPKIDGLVVTFYIMLIGAVFCIGNALLTGAPSWLTGWKEIGLVILLGLITAVLSNLTLVLAIRRIGPTLTSILGVMEPLTAVAVGCLVFGEPVSLQLCAGAFTIIASVLLVLLAPKKHPMHPVLHKPHPVHHDASGERPSP